MPTVCNRYNFRGGSLLNDMVSYLPHDCKPFLIADNVLVASRNRHDCLQIDQTLVRYFAEHHAGPFAFGSKQIVTVQEGFEQLGYSFKQRIVGPIVIELSDRNERKMFYAMIEEIEVDRAAGRAEPVHAGKMLKQRLGGFAAMDGRQDRLEGQLFHMRVELVAREEPHFHPV